MSDGPIRTERMGKIPGRPPDPNEARPTSEGSTTDATKPAKEGRYILIENVKAQRFGISMPPKGLDENKENFTGSITPTDPELKLDPGINKVDPDLWAKLKSQKMVRTHIDNGIWIEHGIHDTLAGLSVDVAVRLIPRTFEKKLLEEWKKVDERKPVQTAIETQFDLIKRQRRDLMEQEGGLT